MDEFMCCGCVMLRQEDRAGLKCWTCGKEVSYSELHARGIRVMSNYKPAVMVDPIDGQEIEPELRDVIAHEWRTK